MRYLFFDIEGANCYNFVSKMCTFGYVITNESFKVKCKIDVIMNPQASFDRRIIQQHMNAYSLPTYLNYPPFSYFYPSIKKLLENPDQIIIGWSIENDVKYICDACTRYNLPQMNYSYFDLQKFLVKVKHLASPMGLQAACELYHIPKRVSHKSDDDAYLTMKLCQHFCKILHISLEELVYHNQDCLSNVQTFLQSQPTPDEIKEKINLRKIKQCINTYKGKNSIHNPNILSHYVFAFKQEIFNEYGEDLISKIHYIKDCGAQCTTALNKCNHLVYLTKPIMVESNENDEEIVQLSYSEFLDLTSVFNQ